MINILEYVNPIAFFAAFCLGIFIVYISVPEPKVIIKYPTPDNVEKMYTKICLILVINIKQKKLNAAKYKNVIETELQHIDGEKKKKRNHCSKD